MAVLRTWVKKTRKIKPARRLMEQYDKDVKSFQKKLGEKGVDSIRRMIDERELNNTGALRKEVTYKINNRGGVDFSITAKNKQGREYADFLNKGIGKHKMTYMADSKKPLPVKLTAAVAAAAEAEGQRVYVNTDTDSRKKYPKVIFRQPSSKTMKDGNKYKSWKHPGFKRGEKFIDKAIRRVRDRVRADFPDIGKKIWT